MARLILAVLAFAVIYGVFVWPVLAVKRRLSARRDKDSIARFVAEQVREHFQPERFDKDMVAKAVQTLTGDHAVAEKMGEVMRRDRELNRMLAKTGKGLDEAARQDLNRRKFEVMGVFAQYVLTEAAKPEFHNVLMPILDKVLNIQEHLSNKLNVLSSDEDNAALEEAFSAFNRAVNMP